VPPKAEKVWLDQEWVTAPEPSGTTESRRCFSKLPGAGAELPVRRGGIAWWTLKIEQVLAPQTC
jgi:hypothetical protein